MADRSTWEARYDERRGEALRPPSQFLLAHLHELPAGRAVDLACGDGRHALCLARHGYAVTAIDYTHASLERLSQIARREHLQITAIQADLTEIALPRDHFDVAVNIRFLERSLFDGIKSTLRHGGVVVFETFIRDQQQLGHPKNPAFMLERGELAARFADFEILASEEGRFETESGPAYLARIVARRP
jgi:2-polyprenyl-3-methyl-5-hydroxy-6-metoxy-1,4-benzoquinol methylase